MHIFLYLSLICGLDPLKTLPVPFFYHIYLKEILTEKEIELLRKYLVGRKYDKVFEMDKLKNMVKRITEEEYKALKK